MKEKERDWDKEMAEVDRLLNKLPYADPSLRGGGGADPTLKRPGVTASGARPSHPGLPAPGGGRLGTWTRVVLGALIGIGIAPGVWPYTHGCGLRLIFYMSGVSAVIVAGLWSSVSSWRHRLGLAHVISQLLIIWGSLLFAREVLARVGPKPALIWICPDVPAVR